MQNEISNIGFGSPRQKLLLDRMLLINCDKLYLFAFLNHILKLSYLENLYPGHIVSYSI